VTPRTEMSLHGMVSRLLDEGWCRVCVEHACHAWVDAVVWNAGQVSSSTVMWTFVRARLERPEYCINSDPAAARRCARTRERAR
jgi:hypothetical protein